MNLVSVFLATVSTFHQRLTEEDGGFSFDYRNKINKQDTCPRESAKLEAVAVQVEGCPLRGGGDITRQVQEESLEAFIQREISQHQVTQDPSRPFGIVMSKQQGPRNDPPYGAVIITFRR